MEQIILELLTNLPIAGGLIVALWTLREEVQWLRGQLSSAEADNQALMEIIISRTNLTPQAIRDIVKNGT